MGKKSVSHTGPLNERFNIIDVFDQAATSYPGKVALIEGDEQLTFAEFHRQVDAYAARLQEKGLGKGDRILVFVPMSIDLYRVVLAIFRIGATAVFLDEWVSKSRLEACCKVADCRAFVGGMKLRMLALLSPGLRKIPVWIGLSYNPKAGKPASVPTGAGDTALITFTTGRTGTPKAAIRTHGLLNEQFRALSPLLSLRPSDVCLTILPVVLLINLGTGATSVIAKYNSRKPGAMKPGPFIDLIRKYGINTLIASPFFVRQLAQYLIKTPQNQEFVSKIFTGGAPVFPSEANLFREAFPKADIRIVYGSTEAEPISAITAEDLIRNGKNGTIKGLSVGKPEETAQVRIIPIVGKDITVSGETELEELALEPGEIGEIIVSGRHVLNDYFRNPEALRRNKIFAGGTCWHRTGDSGYLDHDGALFLTGRCDSLIRTGKKTLSTFTFENCLQAIDGVNIGTVLLLNGKVTAVIESGTSADREKIMSSVHAISGEIQDVKFLHKIPRDPRHHTKIDYGKLREAYSSLI